MAISTTVPTYRQLDPKGFFSPSAELIPEGEAFEFEGEPNEQMEALNDPAKERLQAMYERLDSDAREQAKISGKPYNRKYRNIDVLIAEASADARRVELRKGDGGIPLTGGASAERLRRVVLEQAPKVNRLSRAAQTQAKQAATSQAQELV